MDDRTTRNGFAAPRALHDDMCGCGEAEQLRSQVVALGTAIEHALDVVEACLEVLPEHDTRVDRNLDAARVALGRVW